jgi:hypothetical protein
VIPVKHTPWRERAQLPGAIPVTLIAGEAITTCGTVLAVMMTTQRDVPEAVFTLYTQNAMVQALQGNASDQGYTLAPGAMSVEWWNDWIDSGEDES